MSDIHVTVAAVIQQGERFLIVEEKNSKGETVFNQPAGHVEAGESIPNAVVREVFEETGLTFTPKYLIGNYFLSPATNGKHYLRMCFYGEVPATESPNPQDPDILNTHWMTINEITGLGRSLRSALVLKCLEDFLVGCQYPMDQFHFTDNEVQLADLCYTRLPPN